METTVGIQARLAWKLFFEGSGQGVLREPDVDYAGVLEGMEAADLLALMGLIQERLRELNADRETGIPQASPSPSRLFIDKNYSIRRDSEDGAELSLRPLVKALFILFLKHPEGIRLKNRAQFEPELSDIYAAILPDADPECRDKRIRRMMDLADNSFSEKASVLNARLDDLFGVSAVNYKIQGSNGHPRRIPLDPLMVVWL